MFWTKQKKSTNKNISLKFDMNEDGNISIICAWPTPDDEEQADVIADAMSRLIFISTNGTLYEATQNAVKQFNSGDDLNSYISRGIMSHLKNISGAQKTYSTSPVVSPRNCFKNLMDEDN